MENARRGENTRDEDAEKETKKLPQRGGAGGFDNDNAVGGADFLRAA